LAALLAAALSPAAGRAQTPGGWTEEWLLPRDPSFGSLPTTFSPAPPSPNRQRFALFRFAPGFLVEPLGLQDDDDLLPGTSTSTPALPPEPDTGPDWIQVSWGQDNPYFDFRQRGDPGGLGFYRLNTQVQLLDTRSTCCTLGFQAVAPAGIQYNGVPDGPTVVSPAVGLFHALDDATAIQGFVGKHLLLEHASMAPTPVPRFLNYGMALQRCLTPAGADGMGNLFVFVGALGHCRTDDGFGTTQPLKLLPGLHWRLTDNWWMSGGVLFPVNSPRPESGLPWQFTCSLHF
jgi:hypothetical protein